MAISLDLSDQEKKAIDELRERMEGDIDEEMNEDTDLFYRFLKAQDLNVYNAELMLRKHLRWRAKHDVKNIGNYNLPEVARKYFPYTFLGHDKEGCVIRYSPVGNIDMLGLLKSIDFNEIKKGIIYHCEDDTVKLKMKSKELGKNINQCVYICNLEHFTFRKCTNKKVALGALLVLKSFQNNYPGRIKAAYVINGSLFISVIYNYIKFILTASFMDKVHFYYDDSWKQDLLEIIDADVLPACLGGNRTDPDGNPLCLTFMNHGELVPETYYLNTSKKALAGMEGVKKLTLSRAEFHEEIFEITEPQSTFEWEFETECRDIGFGVFYEEVVNEEKSMIPLVPHRRIETEECSETGMLICEKTGTYVFLFDNSYSWIRSKEIYYRIKVIPPAEKQPSVLKSL